MDFFRNFRKKNDRNWSSEYSSDCRLDKSSSLSDSSDSEQTQAMKGHVPKTDWRSIYIANIVAFLASVTMSSITPTVWPYMKKVDVTSTETFYGFIRGLYSLGNVLFSIPSGWISNRICDTRPMMVIGKTVAVMSALCYLFVEVFSGIHVVLFIAFEFLLGMSSGLCSVFRTHIAMASTEADRPKAFGITQLVNAAGFVIGPLLQVIFAQTSPYPGIPLLFGTHFNLYTAPVALAAVTSIIGIVLLFLFFDGRMRIRDPLPMETKKVECEPNDSVKYDHVAVVVLIVVKICSEVVVLNLITICPPYAMTVFQWSSEDTIVIQSAIMGSIGLLNIVFALGYVIFKLGAKFSERNSLTIAVAIFLVFHLITYPWGLYSDTIEYHHVKGTTPPVNRSMALQDVHLQELIAQSKLPDSTIEIVGCNLNFAWCETTPKINIVLFIASLILALGIGLPLIQINLDVMYSKVLGPIKQGTLQGIFVAVGQGLNIVGPFAFSSLYTLYGPRILWGLEISLCVLTLLLMFVYYGRIIPWSTRALRKSNKLVPIAAGNITKVVIA